MYPDQTALNTSSYLSLFYITLLSPGRAALSITCLATDVRLTANPGIGSSIPAWSHTFVEINHETISTVILLSSADRERSGSVVECLTREVRASPASLCCALERDINPSLVLVQPKKTRPKRNWKIVDWGVKNQINQTLPQCCWQL